MTKILWDKVGERKYETGVDHGVLYTQGVTGDYTTGVAWNGLISVTESPSGAESNKQYADNIVYVNLVSAEAFDATIEAFSSPVEFDQHDGTVHAKKGVNVGQQGRKPFGLSYRTKIGNDLDGDLGYKLHLVYGAQAAPSERTNTTVNDSPEAMTLSWAMTTTPVAVTGLRPTATLTIDSTLVAPADLAALEVILYGAVGVAPELPMPDDVIAMFSDALGILATPLQPLFTQGTNTITIPTVVGVEYRVNGSIVVAGPLVIATNTVVTATPAAGYRFPLVIDTDWLYTFV